MKNFKWGTESFNEYPIYVFLFVSRNKDNKDIEGFKERRKSFIAPVNKINEIYKDFEDFVNRGVNGEFCRMYRSVNSRDTEKIHKQLLHFLFDNPDFNLCDIQPKLAGIAAQKECALEKQWMFDFDLNDEDKVKEFINDINEIDDNVCGFYKQTPHGYAIITNKGFDTRELVKKWPDVTLKKDDLICVTWHTKGENIE
jgi:hypothetical protein